MKVILAAALVALGPPRLCLPRSRVFLAIDDSNIVNGRRGHEVSLQNMVDRGEAATLEEAQQVLSRKGNQAALQNMVDRGEAATMEEAQQAFGRKGQQAALQNMVDRGDAATLEEAAMLTGVRMRTVTLQNMVDRGEAATLEEAEKVAAQKRRAAFDAKYSFEEVQPKQSATGIKVAKQRGFRSNYPGVRWQKKQDKKTRKPLDEGTGSFPETSRGFWRVSFSYKGKFISVGSGYEDEEAAARAHDEYVREHKLSRRLYFPRPGDE